MGNGGIKLINRRPGEEDNLRIFFNYLKQRQHWRRNMVFLVLLHLKTNLTVCLHSADVLTIIDIVRKVQNYPDIFSRPHTS